jgi:hypothetical protein
MLQSRKIIWRKISKINDNFKIWFMFFGTIAKFEYKIGLQNRSIIDKNGKKRRKF